MTDEERNEKRARIREGFEKVIASLDDEELEHYALAADILNELHGFMSMGPVN